MKDDFVIENVSDAFLALNQIDDDDVKDMIKSKKPRSGPRELTEGKSYSVFSSQEKLAEAEKMLHDKKHATEIEVIDPDADSIEHIKNKEDYVGQAILCCNKCAAKRFIDLDALVVDPNDSELFNPEDECPNCKSSGLGFNLIGQVGKVPEEKPEEELEKQPEEVEMEESADNDEFDVEDIPDIDDVEFPLPEYDDIDDEAQKAALKIADTETDRFVAEPEEAHHDLKLRFKSDDIKEDLESTESAGAVVDEARDVYLNEEMEIESPADTSDENNNRPFSSEVTAVMVAYQNANKWLDSVKEVLYSELGCPFFSSFVHKLAHTMPERFDKFGEILHTNNIEVPYPATVEIENKPTSVDDVFNTVFAVLDNIKEALTAFISAADTQAHGMACGAEELLTDIDSEYPAWFRLADAWMNCHGDVVEFDKYVMQYVDHHDDLVEGVENMTNKIDRSKMTMDEEFTVSYFTNPEIEYDDDIDEMYGKDMLREANEESVWGKKAWMLGQIMMAMNDEDAYYGGWLYIWPDGETEEDCMYDFADEEDYRDLEDSFKRYYKAYHSGGLFEASPEVEAAAHAWDRELGIAPIENIKRHVREALEEEDDEDDDSALMIQDLLDCIIEPENIDLIRVVDGDEVLFEGTLEKLPEDFYKAEFTSFNTAQSKFCINVDLEEESEDIVDDLLGLFDDEETDQIIVTDVASSDTVFEGNLEDCRAEHGNDAFVSIEAPECLVIDVSDPESDDEEPTDDPEDDSDESDDVEDVDDAPVDESLFEAICKANGLATYRVDKIGSPEYWIHEALGDDADEMDHKTIYEAFVRGYGKDLETRYKKHTGYRETFVESLEDEKVCPECGKAVCECDKSCLTAETESVTRSFRNRQDLADAIAECKNNNRPFRVVRSQNEGFRYDLITDEGLLDAPIKTIADAVLGEDKEVNEDSLINTPVNVDLDLSNLGGSGNDVKVLSNSESEELDEDNALINAPLNVKLNGHELLGHDNDVDVMSRSVTEDNQPVEYTGPEDAEEYTGPIEILDAEEEPQASTETAVAPADMSPEEMEMMQKIGRIANDISNAIHDTYGIEASPALIVADIMQDLRLIGGAIDVRDLEDTPMNNLTAQMFNDYNQMYEMVDGIMSMLTGSEIRTTPDQKLAQAVAMLDTPAFSTPAIQRGIASTRFLQAARAGAVPYIGRNELRMLEDLNLDESIEFDTDSFDKCVNEALSKLYESEIDYCTVDGVATDTGVIKLTGILESADHSRKVVFTLTPKTKLTEELETIEDVGKALEQKEFLVTNNISEEVFDYVLEREPDDNLMFADSRSAAEVIREFDKAESKNAIFESPAEKLECVAGWEYINHMDFYTENGYDVPIIKAHLAARAHIDESFDKTSRVLEAIVAPKDGDDWNLADYFALKNWAEFNDLDLRDFVPEDAQQIAQDILRMDPSDRPERFSDIETLDDLTDTIAEVLQKVQDRELDW